MSNLYALQRKQQEKEKLAISLKGVLDAARAASKGVGAKATQASKYVSENKKLVGGAALGTVGLAGTALLLRKLLRMRAAKKGIKGILPKGKKTLKKAYKSWNKAPTGKKVLIGGGAAVGAGGLAALLKS